MIFGFKRKLNTLKRLLHFLGCSRYQLALIDTTGPILEQVVLCSLDFYEKVSIEVVPKEALY